MTDSFDVAGEFAPAQSLSNDSFVAEAHAQVAPDFSEPTDGLNEVQAAVVDTAPNGFALMGLAPELLQAVADLGFTQPTTVQVKTIPLAMQAEGQEKAGARFTDLMVSSQTGSGKTAAFLLPVLHTLLQQEAQAQAQERAQFERAVAEAAAKGEAPPKRDKRKDPTNPRNFKPAAPGALILCPTRELAQQVAHDAIDLVKHCRGLRIANVVGGMPYQLQIAKLQNANLVVATPGRLLDLQRSMQIKLDKVQFLVVDEADRMLDLGFSDDLAEVNQLTIERKQTMMFSATFAPRIQQLAQRVMREPQRVQIDSPQEKHQNIKQILFWADNLQHKRKLLDHWLRDTTMAQAIVFSSTQIECDGLANDLQQDGFSAVALHGALSQGLRNRRLMAFRDGQVQILVATDVAARGLDVPSVSHVFNFGLPMKAEDYTHRIGRTGRAGRDGTAVTMAELRDRRRIFDIEAYTRQPFKSEVIPGLEPKARVPDSRPSGNFGDRDNRGGNDRFSRDSRSAPSRGGFGAGRPSGGFGGGFADRNARGPAADAQRGFPGNSRPAFAPRGESNFGGRDAAPRDGQGFERKGGFAGNAGPADGFAPRSEYAPRKPAFGKPAHGGGKVFVPRDAKKSFR